MQNGGRVEKDPVLDPVLDGPSEGLFGGLAGGLFDGLQAVLMGSHHQAELVQKVHMSLGGCEAGGPPESRG